MVSQGLVGATFPITIAGTMVCGLAEELAGLVLIQAVQPGCPCMLGQSTNGLDMRTGLASVGCPEMALVMATTVQLGERLGIPSWTAGM